ERVQVATGELGEAGKRIQRLLRAARRYSAEGAAPNGGDQGQHAGIGLLVALPAARGADPHARALRVGHVDRLRPDADVLHLAAGRLLRALARCVPAAPWLA